MGISRRNRYLTCSIAFVCMLIILAHKRLGLTQYRNDAPSNLEMSAKLQVLNRTGNSTEIYRHSHYSKAPSSLQMSAKVQMFSRTGNYNGKHSQINNNLTYYTLPVPGKFDRRPDMNSKLFGEAINRQHQIDFVKPEGEKCVKRFPTAAIIGVDKCGTRELLEFLHLHPLVEIYFDKSFEMNYFGRSFSEGKNWFLSKMPCSYSNQITIFKESTYFHKEKIPNRIFEFNPNMKLILLVREPVSRTISRYMFDILGKHLEPGTTLEDVVFQNRSVKDKQEESNNFIWHSTYDDALKQWLRYFNISQIMIIESEELKHKPAEVLMKAEQFLNLPHYIKTETFIWNEEKGYHCLKTNLTESGMICYGKERGKTLIDINPETKARLEEYFRPKNQKFFKLIGRTFDNWKWR